MGDRLVDLSAAGQSQAEVVVGLRVVGLDFQGLLVMGDGLVDLAAAGQSDTEVVVGIRVVGLDFQRLLVMGDGLVDLAAVSQSQTEVVVGALVFRRPGDRILPDRQRTTVIRVALESDDSECQSGRQRQYTADKLRRPQAK